MGLLEIVSIGVGLSMDAFAVAIVSSVTLGKANPRQLFRLSFHFGLFQALMPALGWLAGQTLQQWVQSWDHWVAFGILAGLGAKAAYEGLKKDDAPSTNANGSIDPTRGVKLVALSVATSLDAMAAGMSFAMLGVSIVMPVLVIGCITASLTFIGMKLGARLGLRFGKWMEVLGGVVLAAIGVMILVEHFFY